MSRNLSLRHGKYASIDSRSDQKRMDLKTNHYGHSSIEEVNEAFEKTGKYSEVMFPNKDFDQYSHTKTPQRLPLIKGNRLNNNVSTP